LTTLIVTEKPKVAEKIAVSLSRDVKKQLRNKIAYYELERGGEDIIIAPAVGHIYTLREKTSRAIWTYPVFDIEWVPSYEVNKTSEYTRAYLKNLTYLAKRADKFINACDFDIEGSVIGFNAIKFACGADPKKDDVKRMRYSTITKESLIESYEHLVPIHLEMAYAGLARHVLDWYWGINLSRALTLSLRSAKRYTTLSIGRVQGPALKMLVDRERQIKAFVPEPYWEVEMICSYNNETGKEGEGTSGKITASYEKGKLLNKEEAEAVKDKCGDRAQVSKTTKKKFNQKPPTPFDLTTLQTEAYKLLKIDPRRTLEMLQNLYTSGYISYPRTSSQVLPPEIKYPEIIKNLSKIPEYNVLCEKLLIKDESEGGGDGSEGGGLKPNNGKKTDPAHPAIHPTGEKPKKSDLSKQQGDIYDLVVRRFFATFADDAVRETATITLDNNGEKFIIKGTRTIDPGWHVFYGRFARFEEEELPHLKKGDILDVDSVDILAKETKPPKRYTPASIIKEMEKHNLGTKATRSQIIDILFKRGYVDGRSIEVTDLGIDVVSALEQHCDDVLSVELTRKFENEVESIRDKNLDYEKVIEDGRKALLKITEKFKKNSQDIGKSLAGSLDNVVKEQSAIGTCPKCSSNLVMRKGPYGNFIGCKNYPKCKYTISLPSGMIKKIGTCEICGYAKLQRITKGRRPVEFCINPDCESKKHDHLFNWCEIPGSDSERFFTFLSDDLKMDWVKGAKIKKSKDGKTIKLTGDKENSLEFKLKKEKNTAIMKTSDGKIYKYILKEEGKDLNIYSEDRKMK